MLILAPIFVRAYSVISLFIKEHAVCHTQHNIKTESLLRTQLRAYFLVDQCFKNYSIPVLPMFYPRPFLACQK